MNNFPFHQFYNYRNYYYIALSHEKNFGNFRYLLGLSVIYFNEVKTWFDIRNCLVHPEGQLLTSRLTPILGFLLEYTAELTSVSDQLMVSLIRPGISNTILVFKAFCPEILTIILSFGLIQVSQSVSPFMHFYIMITLCGITENCLRVA